MHTCNSSDLATGCSSSVSNKVAAKTEPNEVDPMVKETESGQPHHELAKTLAHYRGAALGSYVAPVSEAAPVQDYNVYVAVLKKS